MGKVWREAPIREVAFFQEGPGLRNWQWTDDGIKVINGRNVLPDGQIELTNTDKFIALEEFCSKYKHFEVQANDIVVTSSGTLGKVARIRPEHLPLMMNTSVIRFRSLDASVLDDDFLFCYLRSSHFQEQVFSYAIGAAQSNFGPSHIKLMTMPLPPLAIQRRIAGILSAYDHLVENCQRRIKLLETMARALYREWFVSEKLPGNWRSHVPKKSCLGELCDHIKEQFSERLHSGLPLLDLARMTQHSLAPGNTGSPDELTTSRILFRPGDTLFGAIRCYLHKVNAAHFPGVTNTSVLVLRPKAAALRSLVAVLTADPETVKWADTHSAGTKMPVISWIVLRTMPAPLPSEGLAIAFEATAGPMLDQIGVLATQVQNLRRTRDLLLPRLLSGQIEVGAP